MRDLKYIKVSICAVVAIIIIVALFVLWLPNSEIMNVPDSDRNLLYEYKKDIDIDSLFNQPNEITQVATRYSVLYKENNYRTMYVFSVPVRDYINDKYSMIETNVIKIDENTYKTINQDYFIEYTRDCVNIGNSNNWLKLLIPDANSLDYYESFEIINNRNALIYKTNGVWDIEVSPIYNGIVLNCNIKDKCTEILFPIDMKKYRINNANAGYVVLSEHGSDSNDIMANNYFVISRPLINNSIVNGVFKIIQKKGEYYLRYKIPDNTQFPFNISFTINYYCENMFFDCAAYEKTSNQNHIFDSYVVFDDLFSENKTNDYMKFNIRSFTPKKAKNLDSVLLNVNVLSCIDESVIEVYSVKNDWCSWLLTWNNKPPIREKIGEFVASEAGWYSIDITEYAKRLIDHKYYNLENNSIMFKTKDDSNGYIVLASGDNNISPPFFEVKYRVE